MLVWAGIIFGLLSALTSATKSVFTKVATQDTDSLIVTLFSRFVGFVLLLPVGVYFLHDSGGSVHSDVVIAVLGGGAILGFTSYMVTLALEKTDLSVVSPLLSFVPVAVILPSTLLVGETPTVGSGIGIALVSIGGYSLNINDARNGFLEPVKSIVYDRGAQFAMGAVVLFSVVPSLNKLALSHTSPVLLATMQLPVSGFILSIVGITKLKSVRSEVEGNLVPLIGMSVTTALLFVLQFTGYQYTQISYIQAIKQIKVMFAVLAGYYIFGEEEKIGNRLMGGLVMVFGSVLVILFS